MIGGGFEKEIGLVKEKQQRKPQDFKHVSVPGVGRVSLNDQELEGDKIGEVRLAQPCRVLKASGEYLGFLFFFFFSFFFFSFFLPVCLSF